MDPSLRGTPCPKNRRKIKSKSMSGTQEHCLFTKTDDEKPVSDPSRGTGELIRYRPLILSDKNFIYSTWLKGLYYGNNWFREIDKETYFKHYSQIIQHILMRPNVYVNTACLKDDIEVILAYSVLEATGMDTTLHWVFTKASWRDLGIAKKLIPANVTTCSHLTKVGRSLKPKEWKFNPFFT